MMRRSVLALAIVVPAVLWSAPGLAEGALAVGLPARGPSGGFVFGMTVNRELDDAQSKAMDICRGIERENNRIPDRPSEAQATCKIIGVFKDKCTAVAYNGDQHTPSTAVGWAIASSSTSAEREAIAKCNGMRSGSGRACRVEGSLCDGDAETVSANDNVNQESGPAQANELAIVDLFGRWCPADNAFTYSFSQKQLDVRWSDGKTRVLVIRKIEFHANDNSIQIFWLPEKDGNSTSYTMTPDKRVLIQLPQTAGDKGPRRELRRC